MKNVCKYQNGLYLYVVNMTKHKNLSSMKVTSTATAFEQRITEGKVWKSFYSPSGSNEWFDGNTYYNNSGEELRDPCEYDECSEGYTPFGDE